MQVKNKIIETNFNKIITTNIIADAIAAIGGVVMLLNPEFSMEMFGIIIAIIFLIKAAGLLFDYFMRDGAKIYSMNLIFGTTIAVMALFLLCYPKIVIDTLKVCIALFFVILGSTKINYGIWLKKGGEESFAVVLGTGVLAVLIGLILIFCESSSISLTKIIGGFIIISSVLSIMGTLLFKKRANQIIKIFW